MHCNFPSPWFLSKQEIERVHLLGNYFIICLSLNKSDSSFFLIPQMSPSWYQILRVVFQLFDALLFTGHLHMLCISYGLEHKPIQIPGELFRTTQLHLKSQRPKFKLRNQE